MEYNTQREKIKISDYGRNIYKLIQYTKTEEDRDKRNQMAKSIVDIMAQIDQDSKDTDDYKRKYWVHLMILANWELDVDVPYDITPQDTVEFTPRPIVYNQRKIHYRHYGQIMEDMIKRVAEYPEGEEREELVKLISHAMKRDYLLWNRDTVDDELITMQLENMSKGKLQLPEGFEFMDFREYLKGTDDERRANGTRKKKKKKK
ncbi:MAG: DUF4290 domain-containing protein [Bacteroidales bacterium]|nr:DUF4290 domain-containing protein [Candidatus Colimorpha merdihippi]MCQ2281495.1 DUF4290 domain-containing protein [Bacteroidales bacterium]